MSFLPASLPNQGSNPIDTDEFFTQLSAKWEQVVSFHKDLQAPNTDFQILFLPNETTASWKIAGEMNTIQQLGLPKEPTDWDSLFPLFHPRQADYIHAINSAFAALLTKSDFPHFKEDLKYFAYNAPFQYPDSQYYLVRVLIAPFFPDHGRNLVPLMHYYHKLDTFRGEPLSPFIEMRRQDRISEQDVIREIRVLTTAMFKNNLMTQGRKFPFSRMELEVLKAYHMNPEISISGLANQFHRGEKTIADYNKSILKKGRQIFPKNFEKGKDVAEYWIRQGLNL